MPTVQINGIRLNYEMHGKGAPLLTRESLHLYIHAVITLNLAARGPAPCP